MGYAEDSGVSGHQTLGTTGLKTLRGGCRLSSSLALFLHERTDGNALFMLNLVEHLVQQRLVVWREGQWILRHDTEAVRLPEGLRQLLLRRIEALPVETRRLLEAASVVGETFTSAAVAAGTQCRVEDVDAVCWLSLLAEAYILTGQPDSGMPVLDEALTLTVTTEERWWEAELYRLKGELLRHAAGGIPSAALTAEACFQQALAVARCRQAKALQLRAALSLSRLWQQRGELSAARELLVPIYDWFTEGFATADLREAKALLEVLGQS